jgi:hypothetical protein
VAELNEELARFQLIIATDKWPHIMAESFTLENTSQRL